MGLFFVPVVLATMLSYGSATYRGPAYLGQRQLTPGTGYARQFQAPQPPYGSGPAQ